jgi:hypothetical protein
VAVPLRARFVDLCSGRPAETGGLGWLAASLAEMRSADALTPGLELELELLELLELTGSTEMCWGTEKRPFAWAGPARAWRLSIDSGLFAPAPATAVLVVTGAVMAAAAAVAAVMLDVAATAATAAEVECVAVNGCGVKPTGAYGVWGW